MLLNECIPLHKIKNPMCLENCGVYPSECSFLLEFLVQYYSSISITVTYTEAQDKSSSGFGDPWFIYNDTSLGDLLIADKCLGQQ